MDIRTNPGRVLYVADDPDTDVRDALRDRRLDIVESRDVPDAIERVDRERIDCVVASFRLSESDGIDCCERLRARDEDVPFFLLVAPEESVDPVRTVNADVTDIVALSTGESAGLTDFADRVATTIEEYRDRLQRETKLQRDSEMLQSLLDNIPMSIYFKNEHGIHEQASDYIIRNDPSEYIVNDEGKIHQHVDDVIGKSDFDLYTTELAEETLEDDRRVIDEEETIVDKIEKGTTALGETQYFSTTKAPRYDADGNVIGLVGVTLNVTDRIEHQQAVERQNDRLEEFASVVSHDLRNPLNIAQAHLSTIESGEDDGTAVAECRAALNRMEQLIEDVLVFAREGRTVEETEPIDLEMVTRAAWQTVDTGDATLEVETDLPIRGDRSRITRLIENLFRNSVEHGRPDGTDVTIRVGDMGNDFYVEDDGVGIPENKREDVLERGVTTSPDGTGFGLAIVRNIASAHGWEVEVTESDEGSVSEEGAESEARQTDRSGGARFEFTGVVRATDEAPDIPEAQADADTNPSPESGTQSD